MNALTSYLRHIIVSAIMIAAEKYKLPIEGSEDAVNIIALTIVGTLSWLFVKYVAPYLKTPKGAGLGLITIGSLLMLPSCQTIIPSYNVDGSDIDWVSEPIQVVPASKVTPNINIPLPSQVGGGSILVPIIIEPTK